MSLFETAGDDYFSPEALEYGRGEASGNSRATIIRMSPDDFLKMAKIGYGADKEARVRDAVDGGSKLSDIPYLGFVHDGEGTAQVVGHEGRHRAIVLKSKGVTSMPVLFKHMSDSNGQTIRWNNVNSTGYDGYRDEWPIRLYGEERSDWIPFPVADPRPGRTVDPNHPLLRPDWPPAPKTAQTASREPAYDRDEIDELLRQLGEGHEAFTNELDHEITVDVETRPIDGVDGVWIDMVGPDSEAENHITRQEAEVLYRLLGDALRDVENRVCKTPGANYQTNITDDEVGITVKLPPEVEVPDMSDDDAEAYEDMMHDAMEEILARMLDDHDELADEHWAEARKNDH